MLIDTHSHLADIKKIDKLLSDCKNNFVTEIISISTNIDDSRKNVVISNDFQNIYCSVGIHPGEILNTDFQSLDEIEQLAHNPYCKAIGEIGLDFYYKPYDKKLQLNFFEKQIEISEKLNLPFIIHCRDAYQDAIKFLKKRKPQVRFVFHCFTENYETAKQILDLGGYISFTGIITFKKSASLRELIKKIPIESFMIETDSPYLSPEPKRGKINNSSNLIYIAECISKTLNIDFEKLGQQLRFNSVKFFNI